MKPYRQACVRTLEQLAAVQPRLAACCSAAIADLEGTVGDRAVIARHKGAQEVFDILALHLRGETWRIPRRTRWLSGEAA